MNKITSPNKSFENVQPSATTDEIANVTLTPFWLLNAGATKKPGKRSAGILNYHGTMTVVTSLSQ
ncbi:hypothetical protein LPB67_09370 [Undibacterium sp. Jales W-56]|uniref:hypothetical protein n=1 Tax=Undibacterium sp. Jales W-56 TaxID=2897325 RepID=UPI0021D10459|nr:hypothetical protein [Undibacterium sp. Jales W-56]MCU6433974.1 hypothetical protein [Undibacterium sp. Jales W-56]